MALVDEIRSHVFATEASALTTPRCRFWPRATPEPASSGPTCTTTSRLSGQIHQRPCSSSRWITAAFGTASGRLRRMDAITTKSIGPEPLSKADMLHNESAFALVPATMAGSSEPLLALLLRSALNTSQLRSMNALLDSSSHEDTSDCDPIRAIILSAWSAAVLLGRYLSIKRLTLRNCRRDALCKLTPCKRSNGRFDMVPLWPQRFSRRRYLETRTRLPRPKRPRIAATKDSEYAAPYQRGKREKRLCSRSYAITAMLMRPKGLHFWGPNLPDLIIKIGEPPKAIPL